jgi:hypothetical protein
MEDKGLKWDLIKMELRSSTICFSKGKAKENREQMKKKMEHVNILENEINVDPTEERLKKYYECKKYIEDFNNEKAKGALIRSKIDWAEHGEKNSKFFLNLEKRNYNMKCITKLLDENSDEISKPDEILTYEEHFYKRLYSETNVEAGEEITNFFKNETLLRLSNEDREICEGQISIEEIGKALKQLKNGKSPGSDGFTTDFYKFFWGDIKNIVLDSIIYAYEVGKLSIDQRRGIINLIPKKNKDPRELKNWRPISLLNTNVLN